MASQRQQSSAANISFSKICLTTDFSKNAAAALPYAVTLARQFNGEISLVHVFDGMYLYEAAVEAEEGEFPNPAHWLDPIYKRLEVRIKELAVEYAKRENVSFTPVLLTGHAVDQIVEFLNVNRMDCLVIATHGRKGISHALYGSIAESLVRLSPLPVITIRPARLPAEKSSKIKRS